jgi:acetyltransferase-like isoleucine patch superfamily enzyme
MILGKIFSYITNTKKWGLLYERFIVHAIPEIIGGLSLKFYGIIYPNFHVGPKTKCWGSVVIRKTPGSIVEIGNNANLVSDFVRSGITIFSKVKITTFTNSARIIVGNGVSLTGTSISCRSTSIEIMDGTIIAPNVIIVDSDFHLSWPPENRMRNSVTNGDKPVTICKNVWIGTNALILKGVTIGENSVIGAGSVVVKDIPANVVAAGNPARVVRNLGSDKKNGTGVK